MGRQVGDYQSHDLLASLLANISLLNLFKKFSIQQRRKRNGKKCPRAPIIIRKDTMMILIWYSLRNAGLIMDLTKGGVHWAADVATVLFVLTTTMQVVALVLAKDDPERLFECFSVLSFCGMGVIKLYSLRRYNDQWRTLLNEIAKLEVEELSEEQNPPVTEYESDSEDEFSVTSYIDRYTRSFNSTHALLTRIYSFTAIVFIISPFVEFCLWKYKGQGFIGYPHVLPMWTPLDKISIYGYILTILLETITSVYCVCVHVAFDLSTVGLMMFVHGQFSLLHAKSERIAGNGKSCVLSKARDERAHQRIKNCHRVHIVLTDLIQKLNQLTRNILGLYYCVATITLCSVAVQLKSNLSTTQLISLLQYLGATITQLFLFCNYGDAVLNESAVGMGKGPQGAGWWCLSPRIRRELLLLMIGMSRRYQLYAEPFFSLDLPTFIQIVRTAYSYYAVLRRTSN